MGAFNERAEKLMDKLADMADTNTAANMQHMFNCVTLDVITKVTVTSCYPQIPTLPLQLILSVIKLHLFVYLTVKLS
jgi:hypothetical protein